MQSAKLFINGRSQAVRLPKEFQFSGNDVLIQKVGDAVILLPHDKSWEVFLHGLNNFTDDFMKEGREQGEKSKKRRFLMYLLDTNICIYIIKKKPVDVLKTLKTKSKKDIYVSSITIAELEYGVAKSQFPEKNKIALIEFLSIFNILFFDDTDAVEFGMIKTDLEKKGKIIGPMDLLIAGQAKSKKLILVTNNIKEFERVEGLKIENWVK